MTKIGWSEAATHGIQLHMVKDRLGIRQSRPQECVERMDLHKGLKNSNIWNIEWPGMYQGTQYGLWSSEQQTETRQVEHGVFPLFEIS